MARVLVGRPVEAVAAPHHRLGADLPGEAQARRELRLGGVALVRRIAVDPGVHEPAPERRRAGGLDRPRPVTVEPDGQLVVLLLEALLELVTQAEVEGQVLVEPEVVLGVHRVVVDVGVDRSRHGDEAVFRGVSEQERGQRVRVAVVGAQRIGARELAVEEVPSGRLAGIEVLRPDLAVGRAELDRVLAHELGHRRVGVPGVVGEVVDGAVAEHVAVVVRAVGADAEVRELLHGNLADEARREAERARVERRSARSRRRSWCSPGARGRRSSGWA